MSGIRFTLNRLKPPLTKCLAKPPDKGCVNLFWLGQAGFAIRSFERFILVDVYLSDILAELQNEAAFNHARLMPSPLAPDEVRGLNFLLASHGHEDHLDPGSVAKIMAWNPECLLICPRSMGREAERLGADPSRIAVLEPMTHTCFGPVCFELIPSAHETLAYDKDGNVLFGGFVIELEGTRIYHSGDCVPYDGLAAALRQRGVDLALLPVNGRDALRRSHGVVGNFTIEEAAELCIEAGIGTLVPHHFGLFDFNTVSPGEIAETLERYRDKGLHWFVPDVGHYLSACSG